ncbi:MAG: extensin family protein [Pseudomonadota bacterium]
MQGSVCGDPSIRGKSVQPVTGKIRGCGIAQPVQITAVDGVALSRGSLMDCTTAQALKTWVATGLRPAIGKRGGGVAGLKVAAHYSCRTRNNQPGARISEHGKGRAIDISAIVLKDGTEITVLEGWRSRKHSAILRSAHKAACGPFGTVLGPNADRFHQDHFHFDTARYGNGAYCR